LVENHGIAVHPHDPLETFLCWLHHLAHEWGEDERWLVTQKIDDGVAHDFDLIPVDQAIKQMRSKGFRVMLRYRAKVRGNECYPSSSCGERRVFATCSMLLNRIHNHVWCDRRKTLRVTIRDKLDADNGEGCGCGTAKFWSVTWCQKSKRTSSVKMLITATSLNVSTLGVYIVLRWNGKRSTKLRRAPGCSVTTCSPIFI
jgi:hypothetical protein